MLLWLQTCCAGRNTRAFFLSYFSCLIFARIFVFFIVNTVGGETMKQFIVTLILTTVIVGVLTYSMPRGLDVYIEEINACATVSIYCRSADIDSIDMGSGKIVQCSVAELKGALAHCNNVDGFSVSFTGTANDVDRIVRLFSLNVTSVDNLDGLHIVCGNSARLTGGVNLDGVTVNLQIAYKDGTVTVGSPLILGSY